MNISSPQNKKQIHLAGIIPVAGSRTNFGFPWPSCMNPIADNFLAIERSIEECAYAGCKTIWIIANDDEKPLIRHRLGDAVTDPSTLRRANYVNYPGEHFREVPIFYVPIHPKDRDRRDSYGWSVLHGALTSFLVGQKISKWITPSKYYVSFPHGLYEPSQASAIRAKIQEEKNVFFSYRGETVADGKPLGFTLTADDYKMYVRNIKNMCTGGSKNLPASERWSSRHFGLDKIFKSAKIEESHVHELSWFNKIETWSELLEYYGSSSVQKMKKNNKILN